MSSPRARSSHWRSMFCIWVVVSSVCAFSQTPKEISQKAIPALYTPSQAEAGKKLYSSYCAGCHGEDLRGSTAPVLVGQKFVDRWTPLQPGADSGSKPIKPWNASLDDILFVIQTTMPLGSPKSLSSDEHVAVFAYILQQNGYPAGNAPLQADSPQLKTTKIQSHAQVTSATAQPAPAFIAGDANSVSASQGPTQAELNGGQQSSENWLYHTHDYSGSRFVPLSQIDSSNAKQLQAVCAYQVGEVSNFQTGPIVYQGTMYVTTVHSTMALDASNCRERWRYTWEPKDQEPWGAWNNRGVAIKDGRLVRGTLDGYLLELNAQTGALIWARKVANPAEGETFTMAPMIYDDLILIGPAGSENAISGWVGAFRLTDGTEVWRFKTVPGVDAANSESWKNPTGIKLGGGAVWTPMSLDTAKGELYVAVTNPAPDLPAGLRPGDNRYSDSIIALNVRTGKLNWYKQTVPNDSHDWDLTQVSPLFSAEVNGQKRDLVATVGKDGILRTIDRNNHDTLYATPITTLENVDKPVTPDGVLACPGPLGGVEWNGPAYNPGTHLIYVGAVDWCYTFYSAEKARYIPGKLYMGGVVQASDTSQGWITAVDAVSGKVAWRYHSSRPIVAAVTTTAGGVVFAGELTGDFDVLDARSGDVLYRFNTGGPIGGGMVSYEVKGKQYVATTSGRPSPFWIGKGSGSPTVFVFALP
jgi:alcohol dehydrogenase (cytochrome c)